MSARGARGRAPGRPATLGLTLAAVLVAATGCAKEEAPPGALPDQRPPGIREIVPARGSVATGYDDPLRVRFDEPIEQPGGGYGRELEASPAYRYRVTTSFSEIRVRPEQGWRPGAVYVFRLPGGIRDLLGNAREAPIDVVFSTGPEVTDTRVSGRIHDRLTGQGVQGARALFLPEAGDSIPYTAVSDTGGVFSLPSLPPGRYRAYAFRDLNADLSLDRQLEPHDSTSLHLEDPSASAELTFRMIPPDTTAPVLVRADAVDSFTVVLAFDDPLDPAQQFAAAEVAVRPAGQAALPVERFELARPSPAAPDTRTPPDTVPADTAAPRPDSLPDPAPPADTAPGEAPADTAPTDTVAQTPEARDTVPPDTPTGAGRGPAAGPAAGAADTLPLPSDSLFLLLGRPLQPGRTYHASASGLVNLRGLAGGGDTTFVYTPPDTAEAAPDTAAEAVPADTAGEPPDPAAGGEPAPSDSAPPDSSVPGRAP